MSLDYARACKQRWDGIAKPLNSLGKLEDLICRLAAIQQTADVRIGRRVCIVACADNGVVAEGVTQAPVSVTALQSASIARGQGSVNALAKAAGCDVVAVDVGINTDLDLPGLRRQKAARGTMNITQGPAMTREQMARTLEVGISLAGEMKSKGYDIVCIGEMGIGNTTTSSAVASVLLGVAPERVTGRGAGLSDAGLRRKLDAIHRAIQVNQPDAHDPRDVLRKLGGFDMAAMAGICLGGAKHRVPIVIDGMISAVSALLAARMNPDVLAFLLPSHMSREPSTALIMDARGLDPIIRADMALGEGTGAVALLPLLDLALAVYHQNSTFAQAQIAQYVPQDGA